MSGQWPYPQVHPQQMWQIRHPPQHYMMGQGNTPQMNPQMGLPQGMGVAQGMQGMGVAQGMQGMGVAQGMQGMGVAQGMQGMGVAQQMAMMPGMQGMGMAAQPGIMYQPANSMTGGNVYYQQQQPVPTGPPPPLLGAPPTGVPVGLTLEEQKLKALEEKRRAEAEEKKKREIEEQKRRLQSVNVLKPAGTGATSLNMETLIGFTPSPKAKPKTTPTTAPPITSQVSSATDTTHSITSQTTPTNDDAANTTTTTVTGPSIDDLLLNTMSGLSDAKGKRPVTKSDFKTSSSMKNSPVPVSKTFATSSKAAKVWGEGGDDFSGLFSIEQDTPTPPPPLATHPPPAMSPSSDDDGFGEFQSVSSITERGGGVRGGTVQPLTMTSPPSASPVLVHYQSGGPPVMATSSHQAPSLPSWLLSPSQQLPQLYNDVYQRCYIEGTHLTNTNTLFPLLVSSGLDRSVLHDLWSIVNLTTPGQLTQFELYQLLGLIGLAQSKKSDKVTIHDLRMTTSPPIPVLTALQSSTVSSTVPLKFNGVGVASTVPSDTHRDENASNPSDPYSAFRDFAPPPSASQEPISLPEPSPSLLNASEPSPLNIDVKKSQAGTNDGWADFTSFQNTTTTGANVLPVLSAVATPIPVTAPPPPPPPTTTTDELIWSDDEFTEFSTYQSPQPPALVATPSSPSHISAPTTILSPSPTSPVSSTSTDSSKALGLSEIWCQCLRKCLQLLEESHSILTSTDNLDLLQDLINEKEGQKRIKGLAELYCFAKRLHTSSRGQGKSLMSHSKSETLTELMLNIKKKWTEMRELFQQDKLDKVLNSSSELFLAPTGAVEGGDRCILCLQPKHIFISPLVTIDGCSEDYSLPTVFVCGRLLHVQCANFYKTCLELDIELIP